MNNEPLACPYCNALVPLDAGAVVGQRVPCPRCGEAFTLRQPPPVGDVFRRASSRRQSISTAAGPRRRSRRVHRRLEAGARTTGSWQAVVLGVMGLMAAIGLAYALYTQPTRRAYDTALPPPPRRSPLADLPAPAPVVTAPAALEALRWLPPDCTLIAGVQLTELRQTEEGRDLHESLISHRQMGNQRRPAGALDRAEGARRSTTSSSASGPRSLSDAHGGGRADGAAV